MNLEIDDFQLAHELIKKCINEIDSDIIEVFINDYLKLFIEKLDMSKNSNKIRVINFFSHLSTLFLNVSLNGLTVGIQDKAIFCRKILFSIIEDFKKSYDNDNVFNIVNTTFNKMKQLSERYIDAETLLRDLKWYDLIIHPNKINNFLLSRKEKYNF